MPLYIYFTVFERQVLAYIKKPHAADIIIVVMEYKNTLLKVFKITVINSVVNVGLFSNNFSKLISLICKDNFKYKTKIVKIFTKLENADYKYFNILNRLSKKILKFKDIYNEKIKRNLVTKSGKILKAKTGFGRLILRRVRRNFFFTFTDALGNVIYTANGGLFRIKKRKERFKWEVLRRYLKKFRKLSLIFNVKPIPYYKRMQNVFMHKKLLKYFKI